MSDDTTFRDFDPEDAYDATDPVDTRLDVLENVVDHLRDNRDDRFNARRLDALRVIGNFDQEDMNRREERRLRRLRERLEEMA